MASAAVTIAVPAAPTTLKNQTFDQASKLSLAEQLELAMTILKGLKKAIGGKKASRARDEAEPQEKKNLTPARAAWHANLKVVREAVQKAADPKFSLKNAMSVAKALRTAGSWPEPSQEAILEAYEAWKDGASSSGSASSSVASSQPSKAVKKAAALPDSESDEEASVSPPRRAQGAIRTALAAAVAAAKRRAGGRRRF